MKNYTFEELSKLDSQQLADIHKQKLDEMSEKQERDWAKIAAILFYQKELSK